MPIYTRTINILLSIFSFSDLIEGVIKATRHLVNNYSSEQIGATSHIVLNSLCPALYALLNEGLRPALTTSFGDTPNSVWQVIEASAQPGTKERDLEESSCLYWGSILYIG